MKASIPYSTLRIKTSTVADGNMDFRFGLKEEVIKNRKKFLEKYHLRLEDCVLMELEHEDRVVRVGKSNKIDRDENLVVAEVLLTNEKNVVLFMKTADCLPVTLYDPVHQAIALAHLGRKPTGKELLKKVLQRMKEEFGSEPKNILVFMGPGIKKESYRLLPPVPDLLSETWQPFLQTLPSGEIEIDVSGYNKAQLEACGVSSENIYIEPIDTAVAPEYFSHYRSIRRGGPEGRFATIAWLAEN